MVDRWKEYFDGHLNGETVNRSGAGTDLGVPVADDRVPAPDLHEVLCEIEKLKNNKAAGKDRLAS